VLKLYYSLTLREYRAMDSLGPDMDTGGEAAAEIGSDVVCSGGGMWCAVLFCAVLCYVI
jgi:hypothetical protein